MTRIIKAAIWCSLPCSASCIAAASAIKKPVYLPGRMCIWIKVILMSFNPKAPKAGESVFPKSLRNIWDYEWYISHLFPDRRMFFPNRADNPYGAAMLEKNFLRFWYSAFSKKKDSGVSIRAYDFWHHFVYANMNRWLQDGKDVNAMFLYPMCYMGHSDIKNTLYYFHLVPDIYGEMAAQSQYNA